MDPGRLLGIVIATLGGVGAGAAIAVAYDDIVLRKRRDAEAWALARARVGLAVMVALITEAVARSSFRIPVTWRAVVYGVASLAVAEGYVAVLAIRRRKRKEKS